MLVIDLQQEQDVVDAVVNVIGRDARRKFILKGGQNFRPAIALLK